MQRSARALLLTAWAGLVPLGAETYTISPSPDSHFTLRVAKTGLMRGKVHVFVFERYAGELEYVPDNPEASRVELRIEADSIVCKDDWVSEKDLGKILREARENMLAVDRHRELVFVSTKIRKGAGEGRFEVQGELTIRGRTRPVLARTSLKRPEDGVLSFEGQATVKLKDYGLKPPSAALGLIGTKNEMEAEFRIAAVTRLPRSP